MDLIGKINRVSSMRNTFIIEATNNFTKRVEIKSIKNVNKNDLINRFGS